MGQKRMEEMERSDHGNEAGTQEMRKKMDQEMLELVHERNLV